jgi:isopentenyl-diphosphate delta-isomerase type 1
MAETDLIQIVDEHDNVIGTETMAKARKEGLIHRISRVMVENPEGKTLLQKRGNKVLWPNCWDNSAAGHVDAGEDYLTAAKREMLEEIGIDADELEELGVYFTDERLGEKILKRFNAAYKLVTEKQPVNVPNEEVAEVRWFALEEVKELIKNHPDQVTDGLRDVVHHFYG